MCAQLGSCWVLVGLLVGSGRQLSWQFVFPRRKDGFNDVPSKLTLQTGTSHRMNGKTLNWICWWRLDMLTYLLLCKDEVNRQHHGCVPVSIQDLLPTFHAGVGLDCWCVRTSGFGSAVFWLWPQTQRLILILGKTMSVPVFSLWSVYLDKTWILVCESEDTSPSGLSQVRRFTATRSSLLRENSSKQKQKIQLLQQNLRTAVDRLTAINVCSL